MRFSPGGTAQSWILAGPALGRGSLGELQGEEKGWKSGLGGMRWEPQTLYNSLSTARQRTCGVPCATNPSRSREKTGGAGDWSTAHGFAPGEGVIDVELFPSPR